MKFKDDVCNKHGVRMHRKQKNEFINYVQEQANNMGYDCKVEKSAIAKNIVIGNPDEAEIIFTAHYDTPPRLPKFFVKHMLLYSVVLLPLLLFALSKVPELLILAQLYKAAVAFAYGFVGATFGGMALGMAYLFGFLGGANKTNFNDNSSGCLALLNLMDKYKNLPKHLKNKVAFVFTDNEEKGLLGSIAFKNQHKKTYKEKTFVNLDCVGRGKHFNLYHFGKKTQIVDEFEQIISEKEGYEAGAKHSTIMSLSDHFPVRKANHVCLLSTDIDNPKSLYEQIHSSNDTILEDENIDTVVDVVSNLTTMKLIEAEYEAENRKSALEDLTKGFDLQANKFVLPQLHKSRYKNNKIKSESEEAVV